MEGALACSGALALDWAWSSLPLFVTLALLAFGLGLAGAFTSFLAETLTEVFALAEVFAFAGALAEALAFALAGAFDLVLFGANGKSITS